jgi:hypothetical protein
MITETIYLNRQNIIGLSFKYRTPSSADSNVLDISDATRMLVFVDGKTVDSALTPDAFDWSSEGAQGRLYLDLGSVSGLRVGIFKARVVLYNAIYTKGKTWGYFLLHIKEG